jgi:signal transduction histidine kinase
MKDFATEVLRSKGIEIAFEVNDINEKKSLNPVLKQNLYLIFKESINNIIKHADSSSVRVLISNGNAGFIMTIQDNGKGMDASVSSRGHGLKNMDRRAAAIKAELLLSVNDGTTIQLKCKQI